jgi:hypothetical protein
LILASDVEGIASFLCEIGTCCSSLALAKLLGEEFLDGGDFIRLLYYNGISDIQDELI